MRMTERAGIILLIVFVPMKPLAWMPGALPASRWRPRSVGYSPPSPWGAPSSL